MNTPNPADNDAITVQNGERINLTSLIVTPYEDFAEALLAELARSGRIAAYFAVPVTDRDLELFAVVARDHKGDLRLLRCRVGQAFTSLTPRCPQLHLFEREIAEQFGAVPRDTPGSSRYASIAATGSRMPGDALATCTRLRAKWTSTG